MKYAKVLLVGLLAIIGLGYHNFTANASGDLKKGKVTMSMESCPKFYTRLARYEFRYSISVCSVNTNDIDGDIMKSVTVYVTWKEFGVDKVYESHAFIVPR